MLNRYRDKAHKITESKGFWDEYNQILQNIENGIQLNVQQVAVVRRAFSSERLLLVVSEIGEMAEAMRTGKKADWESYDKATEKEGGFNPEFFKAYIKDTKEDELADALIRIFSLSGLEEIDIQRHVTEKMKYNDQRPRLHGKVF